jgi:hypothetical protein
MKQFPLNASHLPRPEPRPRYLMLALVALALASILLAMPFYAYQAQGPASISPTSPMDNQPSGQIYAHT